MPPKRQSNTALLARQTRSTKAEHGKTSLGRNGQCAAGGEEGNTARPAKRRKVSESDEQGATRRSRRQEAMSQSDSGSDGNGSEGGSDSEGNEWQMGRVGSDDDSDIDSDAAFGESDEERFQDFKFRGTSSGKTRQAKPSTKSRKSTREEPREELDADGPGQEGNEDEDDFGEDAVDLATMLDDSEGEDETPSRKRKSKSSGDHDVHERVSFEDIDGGSAFSASEDEGDKDANRETVRLSALKDLVGSLQGDKLGKAARMADEALEAKQPTSYGPSSSQKLTVDDMLPSVTDPNMRKALKMLSTDRNARSTGSGKGPRGQLQPPLPKRQQDRIDREAAYEQSKETLNRWIDTVKHNRRAEHLSFPLIGQEESIPQVNKQIKPIVAPHGKTELEGTIQNILVQSGLTGSDEKADEEALRKSEDLQAQKIPFDQLQARRAELRIARELLFREELRSKRIKKIKSKSYRRIHRRQRERAEQETRAALDAAGVDVSDEEEARHRQRASERMGQRHRESRWAKGLKAAGRHMWDEDARSDMNELMRRDEELKRRIEGKAARKTRSEDSNSDSDSSSADDEDHQQGQEGSSGILTKLKELDAGADQEGNEKKGLAGMKFMQRAEAARAQENDDAVKELRRDLGEDVSSSEQDEPETVGRRSFGPTAEQSKKIPPKLETREINEFEEFADSDDEAEKPQMNGEGEGEESKSQQTLSAKQNGNGKTNRPSKPVLSKQLVSSRTTHRPKPAAKAQGIDSSSEEKTIIANSSYAKGHAIPFDTKSFQLVTLGKDEDEDNSDSGQGESDTDKLQQELRLRAFGGDDAEAEFEKEKMEIAEEEDDQVIDNTLPGWGNWVGDGVSKRDKKRHKGRVTTTVPGVAPEKRRDAKLDRVIMNEKRMKKNAKYLASSLPHPYENKAQYERSLRLPVGPEWTTKETFQNATKPRVMVKQGVIAPMKKPMI